MNKDYEELIAAGEPFVLHLTAYSPYDGCFWEPNFFVVYPKENLFQPVYASGQIVKGLKRREDWNTPEYQAVARPHIEAALKGAKYSYEYEDCFSWDADAHKYVDEHYWRNFECAAPNSGGRLLDFTWRCSRCEQLVTGLVEYAGYHGNGGVGIVHTDPVCEDCWSANACEKCGEYQTEPLTNGVCEYCLKEAIKTLSDEDQERLEAIQEQLEAAPAELEKLCALNPKMASKYSRDQAEVISELEEDRGDLYDIALGKD